MYTGELSSQNNPCLSAYYLILASFILCRTSLDKLYQLLYNKIMLVRKYSGILDASHTRTAGQLPFSSRLTKYVRNVMLLLVLLFAEHTTFLVKKLYKIPFVLQRCVENRRRLIGFILNTKVALVWYY